MSEDECNNSDFSSNNQDAFEDTSAGEEKQNSPSAKGTIRGKGPKATGVATKPKRKRRDVEDDVTLTFPQHLMEILENESLSEIISWLPHGKAFILVNKRKFAREVLGRYFKQSKFSSFTRKLNRWGFQRVVRGPDTGSYFHPLFQRNNLRLCLQMTSCGSKPTESYPKNTQCDPQSEDKVTASSKEKHAADTSDVFGSSASPSLKANIASLSPGAARGMRQTLMDEGFGTSATGPPSLSVSNSPSSTSGRHALRHQQLEELHRSHIAGRTSAGHRVALDGLDRAGLASPSASAFEPRDLSLWHLQQLDARARAQAPYLVGFGGPVPAGLSHPQGSTASPYSVGFFSQLRQVEEERRRLFPQLQVQMAHVSLAANSNGRAQPLFFPPLVHAFPPPAPFSHPTGQRRDPKAVVKQTSRKDHCFFPSVKSSSLQDSCDNEDLRNRSNGVGMSATL